MTIDNLTAHFVKSLKLHFFRCLELRKRNLFTNRAEKLLDRSIDINKAKKTSNVVEAEFIPSGSRKEVTLDPFFESVKNDFRNLQKTTADFDRAMADRAKNLDASNAFMEDALKKLEKLKSLRNK